MMVMKIKIGLICAFTVAAPGQAY